MRRLAVTSILLCLFAGSAFAQSPNPQRLFEMGVNALTGVGPERDEQGALTYVQRSAQLGYPPAEVMLGYFYDTGTVVAQEPAQAALWYKKAALQDDPLAEWLLGRLIVAGLVPPRDLNEAARWLQKAAEHGNPFGEYLLGKVKLERQDYPAAAEWFRKAAMQGLPQAQEQLGLLLKQGQGVNLDKFQAFVWLQVSYEAGDQSAGVSNALVELGGQLGTTQEQQAMSKAHELEQTANRVVTARGCTGWPGELNAMPAPPTPDIQPFCR
jgi:uncharacterized protein